MVGVKWMLRIIFFQIGKCICPNCKMYLSTTLKHIQGSGRQSCGTGERNGGEMGVEDLFNISLHFLYTMTSLKFSAGNLYLGQSHFQNTKYYLVCKLFLSWLWSKCEFGRW